MAILAGQPGGARSDRAGTISSEQGSVNEDDARVTFFASDENYLPQRGSAGRRGDRSPRPAKPGVERVVEGEAPSTEFVVL
jgi:hypothetical protein